MPILSPSIREASDDVRLSLSPARENMQASQMYGYQ
jgi:hypothetical protein